MVTDSDYVLGINRDMPPEYESPAYPAVYADSDLFGEKPPDEKGGYQSPLYIQSQIPDAFKLDPEALAAIERGEKTELQIKEERANALGMSLRDYLTEEQVAKDRAAWNAKIRSGVNPRTGEKLKGGGFEPPRTEKYGYGKYGRVDDLHAQGFKYGDKPPDDWKAPDYSPEGRAQFENIVFKKIGGNPFTLDINKEVDKATAANAQSLFNEVFRGQIMYSDRSKMTKKQADHWQTQLNKWRAYAANDINAQQKMMEFQYNMAMNQFDARAKAYEKAQDALNKKMGKEVEIFHPDKDYTKRVTKEELPKYEAEGWVAGRKTKAAKTTPTVGDYKKVFDAVTTALKEGEGEMNKESQAIINEMLTSLDMPTLDEIAGVGVSGDLDENSGNGIINWFKEKFGFTDSESTEGADSTKKIKTTVAYATPDEVKAAYKRGDISIDEAKKILMENF